MSAKLFVPAGAPLHASGGERSFPSQVYNAGMAAFGANALDVMVRFIAFSCASAGGITLAIENSMASPADRVRKMRMAERAMACRKAGAAVQDRPRNVYGKLR